MGCVWFCYFHTACFMCKNVVVVELRKKGGRSWSRHLLNDRDSKNYRPRRRILFEVTLDALAKSFFRSVRRGSGIPLPTSLLRRLAQELYLSGIPGGGIQFR